MMICQKQIQQIKNQMAKFWCMIKLQNSLLRYFAKIVLQFYSDKNSINLLFYASLGLFQHLNDMQNQQMSDSNQIIDEQIILLDQPQQNQINQHPSSNVALDNPENLFESLIFNQKINNQQQQVVPRVISTHRELIEALKQLEDSGLKINLNQHPSKIIRSLIERVDLTRTVSQKLIKSCYTIVLNSIKFITQEQKSDLTIKVYETVAWLAYLNDQLPKFYLQNEKIAKYFEDFLNRFSSLQEIKGIVSQWKKAHYHKIQLLKFVNFNQTEDIFPSSKQQVLKLLFDHVQKQIISKRIREGQNNSQGLVHIMDIIQTLVAELQILSNQSQKQLFQIQQASVDNQIPSILVNRFLQSKISSMAISYLLNRLGIEKYIYQQQKNRSNHCKLKSQIFKKRKLRQTQFQDWFQANIQFFMKYLNQLMISNDDIFKYNAQLGKQFISFWIDNQLCQICLTYYSANEFFTAFLCDHAFCYNCLSAHKTQKITAFTQIQCPYQNCRKIINKNQIFYSFLSNQDKKKYQRIQKLNFVNSDPFLKLCPIQGCTGIMPFMKDQEVICPTCGLIFCQNCLNVIHDGQCDQSEVEFLMRNYQYIKCSQCFFVLQRSQGCNHITCKCKYEFCYICGNKWSSEHYSCRKGQVKQQLKRNRQLERQIQHERQQMQRQRQILEREQAQVQRLRSYGSMADYDMEEVLKISQESYYRHVQMEHEFDQQMLLAIQMSRVQSSIIENEDRLQQVTMETRNQMSE